MKYLFTIVFLAFSISMVAAQETCSTIVRTALETAADNCVELGGGQACYGNIIIDAQAQPKVSDFQFELAGDRANLTDIASMRLNSRVEETGEWGISMMQVAAITNEGTNTVELVLFGDVEISDPDLAVMPEETPLSTPTPVPVTVELTTGGNINVRSGPSTNHAILIGLGSDETVIADGRNAAGDWVRFKLDDGSYGWIYAPLVAAAGDVMSLQVVEADDQDEAAVGGLDAFEPPPVYAPMQAFTLQSLNGLSDRPCEAAPDSGLLIQTPQGEGRITLRINEVLIDLGSTAFVQAAPSDDMIVHVLEGMAIVSVESTGVIDPISGALGPVISSAFAIEGMRVHVPMDANLEPTGDPTVEAYEQTRLAPLPVNLVSEAVEVGPAASPFDGTIQAGAWQRTGLYEVYPCGDLATVGATADLTMAATDLAGFAEQQRDGTFASNYDDPGFGIEITVLEDEVMPPERWVYHYNYWVPFIPGNLRPNYGTAHRWDFRYEYRFLTSTRMIEVVTGIFNYCPGMALVSEWNYVDA